MKHSARHWQSAVAAETGFLAASFTYEFLPLRSKAPESSIIRFLPQYPRRE